MPQLYMFVATALAAALISGAGVWQVQNWRWTSNTQAAEIARQKVAAEDERENRRLASKRQSNVIEALNAAAKREQALRVDRAGADRAGGGMRDTLYTFTGTKLPGATLDACRRDAAALAAVLAEVEQAGREMAADAQGHAGDSLMFQEAWPK